MYQRKILTRFFDMSREGTGHHFVVGLSILGWYISSSLLTGSNKYLFDLLDIDVPLLITFIHFSLIAFALVFVKSKYPGLIEHSVISRREFTRSIVPLAVFTAGDVGLSNMAYSRLPITVMTVIKSSAPVCIYTAGVLSGVEKFKLNTSLICLVIVISVALSVPLQVHEDAEAHYEYVSGILMVAVAVGCLASRWVMVQKLCTIYSPMQLIYWVQPVSALVLLPFALFVECDAALGHIMENKSLFEPAFLIFASAFAAMAVLVCEFKIVHDTTSLTLSIAGIGKEVLTLCLSILIFMESFTVYQVISVSVSIVGILCYSMIRSKDSIKPQTPPSSSLDEELGTQPVRTVSPNIIHKE
jgi:solute carrier family 35 protein C2